jgi:signal peptidase I
MRRRLLLAMLAIASLAGSLVLLTLITMVLYRIPSSAMEPTLHCAKPASGCEADSMDRILVSRWTYDFRGPRRGEIVAFETPPRVAEMCGGILGTTSTFVKRLIALPGDRWREQDGYIYINGKRLDEPYVKPEYRDRDSIPEKTVPAGEYILLGDNRSSSCDSRRWGSVPRDNLVGPLFAVYWPPNRIGFR